MACGLAVAALVFSILILIFEVLGVGFCLLNLLLPDKVVVLPFSKWFVCAHIGVYLFSAIFYALHFGIKKYTYSQEKLDEIVEPKDYWKKFDYCYFGYPKELKEYYPDGNGYSVYWGHIFLFIVGILGLAISILLLVPLKIKIFGLLYVIIGFIHVFMIWVVFLSVSVPYLSGARTPGAIDHTGRMCSLFQTIYPFELCPFYSNSLTGLCRPVQGIYVLDFGIGSFTWEVPKEWKLHGCDNGQEISSERNYNFLYVLGKKFYETRLGNDKDIPPTFHKNGYHPWFFSYELVMFIMMSVFYVGFVLVNFNIDFKASLLTK